MRPFVIAMTGGIGSGKSAAAAVLEELGAAVIDTDEIAHRLTAAGAAGAAAIGAAFGAEYLAPDGALDRKRMRELVFVQQDAKKKLEAILHPMIRTAVHTAVQAAQAPYVVVVVPLLVETGAYRGLAQRVLVIDCSEETQVARVMQRSGLTADAVRAIIASQANHTARLAHADDIVINDADTAQLREKMTALHEKYLELARHPA